MRCAALNLESDRQCCAAAFAQPTELNRRIELNHRISKLQKIQQLQHLQIINYAIYIYYKKRKFYYILFGTVRFSKVFKKTKVSWHYGYILYIWLPLVIFVRIFDGLVQFDDSIQLTVRKQLR